MSLAGRGIVVTRPRDLAQGLAQAIERAGGRAILFPAIEIEPLPSPAALRRLADFHLVVFVSPSAARVALASMPPWPRGLPAAAIGSGTRRELERAGIADVFSPSEGADSEALLAAPHLEQVAGKRVLIVRGVGGRAMLGETLAARGAAVEYAECYRRAPGGADPAPLLAEWRRGAVDAVTVSSAQGLDHLFDIAQEWLVGTPLFVPHARVASHARSRGAREVLVAGAADSEVLERLVAYFDGRS